PRRKLGLLLALSAFLAPISSAMPLAPQELTSDFNEGIQLLNQGRKAEALVVFQRILATDPTNEAAYALWSDTDDQVWLDLLVQGGEFELVANRIMDRARLQRAEQRNDADAIRQLVEDLKSADNSLDRRRIIDAMSANHGEFVVPYLLPALGDDQNDDWRVLAMLTLSKMGPDVVLPLLEALNSENAFLRRNVAFTLGNIGDPRAAGPLAAVAALDADETVASAARSSAAKCGLKGTDGLGALLRDGDDYHYRRGSVLAPYMYSTVIWNYEDGELVAHPTPSSIYPNELSKKAYYRALSIAPDSLEAQAGVARACLDIQARVAAMDEAGEDVSSLEEKSAEGSLAVAVAGPDALDLALQWAVLNDDATTGTLLCDSLATTAKGPTAGLMSALDASDGGVRGEAAVALGRIAIQTKQPADARVIDALGQNTGREVVRVAAIIDSDAARAAKITAALASRGVMVNHRGSGAKGLAMLHRIPNVDVIIVGDTIGGMTADAVLTNIADKATLAGKPVFFVSQNEEVGSAYSDRVTGVLSDLDDMSALDSVFEERLTGDRAQADRLAAHSAQALAELAAAGHNIQGTLGALASTLAHRPDAVCVPAMHALALAGTSAEVSGLLAVLVDGARSDDARMAAGDAIAGVLGRHNVDGDAIDGLRSVFASDAALGVRQAAGRALGRFPLTSQERAELMRRVRNTVSGS
ncbi:MAG TPA: HEAT repeat domain-containing protein, partial [Planctomycetota bacterium]|nr:HEAT repeat domain-containing protein [Planctomycetota bacterium]